MDLLQAREDAHHLFHSEESCPRPRPAPSPWQQATNMSEAMATGRQTAERPGYNLFYHKVLESAQQNDMHFKPKAKKPSHILWERKHQISTILIWL